MKMSDNPTKYEVLIEQYLRSILDISARFEEHFLVYNYSYVLCPYSYNSPYRASMIDVTYFLMALYNIRPSSL